MGWIYWIDYRNGELTVLGAVLWVLYVGFAVINPYAMATTVSYYRVMARIRKTKGKGSLDYMNQRAGYCWRRGCRMAMKDAGLVHN